MARFYPEHLPEDVKDTIKETVSHVKGKMDAWHTDRSNFAESVVMDQIMEPLDSVLENWDTLLQDFESKDKIHGQANLTELVRKRAEVIKGLLDSMTPDDMRLTLENLAKMETYGEKFAEILMEERPQFAWVKNALRYVIGLPAAGHNGAAGHNEPVVQGQIAAALINPPASDADPLKNPEFSYACTLLAFANPKQRKEIVAKALTVEKNPKELISRLNQMGAVSPLEAEEFLDEGAFSDPEIEEMGKLWEEKYDFTKRAKYISEESYGAKNMANEMFTLTNLAKVFGYVAGSLTVLLNGITHWQQIKDDPTYIARIPQVWIGVGEIAAASYADSDRTLGEILADKSTLDSWNHKKSVDGLLSVVSASPRGWKKMLEGNGHLGVKVLAEFVGKYSKGEKDLKEKDATLENFKKFLAERNSVDPTKGYASILEELEKIEGAEVSSGISNTRFKKLAMAFSKLEISHPDQPAIDTYTASLDEAQGKIPLVAQTATV